ncbi:thioredoxin family protein [Blautia pseudococcoides]|uniref:thioredoxin family protein n=1 Tax=Blautia pseudococcoides TaxID=1796616 RepID=UPI00351821AA
MKKLLFFHAHWCPPCHFYDDVFINPLEDEVGAEYICRINAQNDPFTAEKYGIDKLPAVIILDGKQVIMRCTGAIDIGKTAELLRR